MSDNKKYTFTEQILFPSTHLNLGALSKAVTNKRILITGASFGIGEQLTYILAGAKADMLLVARSREKLEEVKKQAEQLGGRAEIFVADLTNETELDALISKLRYDNAGIDIFISNAGKSIRRSVFDSLDRFHDSARTMALNYFAPVKLSLALIPRLVKQQGQIITISAANVLLVPVPKWSAYQASKVAFDQWLRTAAPELRVKQVAVSHVYLPLVKTRMIEPTDAYKDFPAMSAEHAAKIICKQIVTRNRKFKPWWLIFGEIGSVLFRTPIEFFMKKSNTK